MQPYVQVFSQFKIKSNYEELELIFLSAFETNLQQPYKASSFYLGWMRGMLIHDNSLYLRFRVDYSALTFHQRR